MLALSLVPPLLDLETVGELLVSFFSQAHLGSCLHSFLPSSVSGQCGAQLLPVSVLWSVRTDLWRLLKATRAVEGGMAFPWNSAARNSLHGVTVLSLLLRRRSC